MGNCLNVERKRNERTNWPKQGNQTVAKEFGNDVPQDESAATHSHKISHGRRSFFLEKALVQAKLAGGINVGKVESDTDLRGWWMTTAEYARRSPINKTMQ